MWKCHKCGKPVYFAERKQSLGYDWHPECLRCEECGKRVNPGQHAEHKGMPYCHVPCYGALFGPQLFGHGTRVESHKSFGVKNVQRKATTGLNLPRDHLESKLKVYNQFYDNKSLEIRSREVNNRLILEGALRVYWGVQKVIHLKEDDDQRTFVVRKRNSCRMSRGPDDNTSDKENEMSESIDGPTTTSEADGMSTDVSLSESITFDSFSLNDYHELPSTPDEVSANTTGNIKGNEIDIYDEEENNNTESSDTLCGSKGEILSVVSTSCASSTLPSKLEKLEWDEIDDLLQVERRITEKDKIYETMPVKLPSSSSGESSPSKPTSPLDGSIGNNAAMDESMASSECTDSSCSNKNLTSSSTTDNFMTASASLTSVENTTTDSKSATVSTTIDDFESIDENKFKHMDFEDFKRSVQQDYLSGANSLRKSQDDTLKKNQPIDPYRIHDSLKLYGESVGMSKSFNCDHGLRSVDPAMFDATLTKSNQNGNLRSGLSTPSSSQSTAYGRQHRYPRGVFGKGINRSKSGPSCFDFSDSDDDDATLKMQRVSNTVRRSDIPQRYIKIEMDCYPKNNDANAASEGESSRTEPSFLSNSGAFAGDELTQTTEEILMTNNGKTSNDAASENQLLHVTEDGVVLRRPPRSGANAIKRRSGNRRSRTKLKRRCSINGHFYNRETSFFTPPYGSQMSVWVTSLVNTQEVINLLLEKYKVDSPAENFSLFIIRDNGEQKRLKDNDYPLITRIMLGPHEDVSRMFLVDSKKTDEISNEVAQFLNLSVPECRAILERYDQELEREVAKVKEKYAELRRRIAVRMESLKVHL